MKVLALCARSFRNSVHKAAGVLPLPSPPYCLAPSSGEPQYRITPGLLEGYDFLYFKLHGMKGIPFWYGDNWTVTIAADTIKLANLTGSIVFAASCHLWDADNQGDPRKLAPMLYALLDAGARCVVGGPGENYAKADQVHGADLLGLYFTRAIAIGLPPRLAFRLAKIRLRATPNKDKATLDALEFLLFERRSW